jgi:preprotein translocase subunit SecG
MNIFTIIQIVIGALLVGAILLQQRGTGLGSTFGGESGMYRSKRGVERMLFIATIILSAIFAINAILSVIAG